MKTKTLLILLCVLAIGIAIGVAGQYYYSSLPGNPSEPSDDDHEHDSEHVVHLSPEDISRYGIEIGTAGPGEVDVHVNLPGQIVVNADRVAHIMPNAAGVVRRVFNSVGDTVEAGEIIAWIESPELGKAKVDYLAKWAELGCCSMDLRRAQSISDSTTELLEILD
jgi:cobalt-zinc-cadmium efflux system membrane fusion protein